MLLNQLPIVPILRVIPASASADAARAEQGIYYHSSNEDRFAHSDQRLIEQNDVINLPKGQAFALLGGGKLYKLRMPLPGKSNDEIEIADSLKILAQKMQQRQTQLREPVENG